MSSARTVAVAEAARILRKPLKQEFPNARFSIRSKHYAGGAPISVEWSDGPLAKDMKNITDQYESCGLDPMINMKYGREHGLCPDGGVLVRHSPSTGRCKGIVPETDNRNFEDVVPADTERVRFESDYIHTHRELSNRRERKREAEKWLYRHCVVRQADEEPKPGIDHFGDQRVTDVAYIMISNQQAYEHLQAAYDRAFTTGR